jgi:hypothetical protein
MPEGARNPDRLNIEYLDLSGGLNEAPPTQIGKNELSELVNWFPYGQVLHRRGGVQYLTLEPCPVPINSVRTYVKLDRTQDTNQLDFAQATFICGASDSVWRYDPLGRWRQLDGSPMASADEPWTMRQYNNAIYMCRRGAGLRVTRAPFTQLYQAGIPAPATASFLLGPQDGGPLKIGAYEYVVTFRNSITRAESGRSKPVRTTISADGKWVKVSNLPQPPAGSQANEIRIWRSLRVGGTPPTDPFDEYYYLATVPAGTTVYEDHKDQIELGALLGTRNDVPPGNVYLFEIWEERAWLSDGREVIWSEVAQPESYYYRNRMLCGPDDGSTITALVGWQNRLIMPKTEAIYYMLHTGPNEFSREVFSDRHGCWAGHSMRSFESMLIWFGGDDFYRSDGGAPYSITPIKLEQTMARIPFERRQEVYAAVFPRRSWYLASIPQREGNNEWREILCYNYKTQAWSRFRHFMSEAIQLKLPAQQKEIRWVRELPGGNLDDGVVCVTGDGHIYQYDSGLFDRPGAMTEMGPWYDIPIPCTLRTAAIPVPKGDSRQWVRRFRLLCTNVYGRLRAMLIRDQQTTDNMRELPIDPRAGQGGRWLDPARRWKLYNLNSRLLGATNQIELEHVGRDEVRVESISVEVTARPEYDQRAL